MSDYEIISIVLMFINTIALILINKDKKKQSPTLQNKRLLLIDSLERNRLSVCPLYYYITAITLFCQWFLPH
ncbi:MAG: hypothetical protein E7387_04370 [Ruminococcaceae bacterium]|nr:hypothetical protein [Oscillospiraceae bacterium]